MKTIEQEQKEREENGHLLFLSGKVSLLDRGKNWYWVDSQKTIGEGYTVFYNMNACECRDYTRRQMKCKHWFAVRDEKLKEANKLIIKVKA